MIVVCDCINSDQMVTEGFMIVVHDCINNDHMVTGGIYDCCM